MDTTKFNIYGLGYVSENKKDDSNMISFIPTEHMTDMEGPYESNEETIGSTQKKVTMRAIWLNLETSSRITAPDVKKGEKVLIFKYADLDDGYLWTTYGKTDFKLRKHEHIEHEWSDNPNPGEAKKNKRYKFILSTREKILEFQSSKEDGEKAIFNLRIDFDKGLIEFGFDTDVGIKLDAETRRMTLHGAGLTIPDGNLIVGKEATIKGDIIGESNLDISKTITSKSVKAINIAGVSVTKGGRGVKTY